MGYKGRLYNTIALMSLLMISGCDSYRLKRDIVAFQKIRFSMRLSISCTVRQSVWKESVMPE